MRSLYGLMIGKKNTQKSPCGWVQIAIEIALLFGIYSSLDSFSENKLVVAVTACDLADTIAVLYAKDLGLPISTVVCTFVENGSVWDFLNKGTFSFSNLPKTGRSMQNNDVTQFLEYLIYRKFGCDEVIRFLSALNRKISYTLREDQLDVLNLELSAAVVGLKRVEAIQSSFLITNQYSIDSDTAVAYGGLQDYRASSGVSKNTLILVKNRMEPIKE